MKYIASSLLLVLILPAAVLATEITLAEDAELIALDGKPLMTIEAGEKFSFDGVDGNWVYGWYSHDAGGARGKVRMDAFREQSFLRRESGAAGDVVEEERSEVEEPFGEEAAIEEPEDDSEAEVADDEDSEEEEKEEGFISVDKLMEYKLPIMIGAGVVLVLVVMMLVKKRSKA